MKAVLSVINTERRDEAVMEERKPHAPSLSFSVESLIASDRNSKEKRQNNEQNACVITFNKTQVSSCQNMEEVRQLFTPSSLKSESPELEELTTAWVANSTYSRKFNIIYNFIIYRMYYLS